MPRAAANDLPEILLRDVRPDDLPLFFEHQRDAVANQMAAFTPRDEPAFMVHWNKIMANPAVIAKTILRGGQVVGNIVSFDRDEKREIGYWIGREHWGQGVATQALRQLLLLEKRRPLWAVVAEHNVGSVRVLEKCGFTLVETSLADTDESAVEEHTLRLDAP